MEVRKITVVSTKTQSKHVINSTAETLADLKADLDVAGIDYQDMTFYEGISKIELLDDSSRLPKDVPYTNKTTGETTVTNNLVFMLTNTNKKIKSGVSRKDLYDVIKANNLENDVMNEFGKNYTHVSNNLLENFIKLKYSCPNEDKSSNVRTALINLMSELVKAGVLDNNDLYIIFNNVDDTAHEESPYTDDEINDMFDF